MKKQCIVTGGAGFIGSHLCELLLNRGFSVVAIDNISTGRIENISSFENHADFTFLKEDIAKPLSQKVIDVVLNSQHVFHLASPASPNPKSAISYLSLPLETLDVNSFGTKQLLMLCKKNNASFLYASTSEVYGDPIVHPQKESYWGNVNSFGPRSCYDEAKRFGEALCYTFIHTYSVNARVIRIFNTYGPRMHKDDGRAIIEFINACLNKTPIPIFGDGKQTRSFCYISDLVEGIYKSMFIGNTKGEVMNLGNPQEITMLELAEKIKEKTKSSSEIKFETLPGDDPRRRQPDISKAQQLLNWNPSVSLDEGLIKTIEYFKHYIS